MTSTPARASETEVFARISNVASLTISYSVGLAAAASIAFNFSSDLTAITIPCRRPQRLCRCDACTIPQCPCDMYSHKQTSPMIVSLGTSRLIARAARCTMPSSAHAPVATSSFFSGSPNKIMPPKPKRLSFSRFFHHLIHRKVKYPRHGASTSLRTPSPGHTNNGYTKFSGASRVSRTSDRSCSFWRRRRSRVVGKAIETPDFSNQILTEHATRIGGSTLVTKHPTEYSMSRLTLTKMSS